MDNKFLLGMVVTFAMMSVVVLMTPFSEQASSIPPTPAWDSITIVYDNDTTATNITFLNATKYNDDFYFISDRSILFNFTSYTP